jgi:hypothetical protein
MMETNTASCGGFPGLSDTFGAALWGLDFSLQMAFANFSGAMMHVGGQNVYYNVGHFLDVAMIDSKGEFSSLLPHLRDRSRAKSSGLSAQCTTYH